MSVNRRFRNYFLRGLAVLLPTILTIWIFVWGYKFIHETIGVHIKHGLVYLIKLAGGAPHELEKFWIDAALSAAGFLVALVFVFIVGAIFATVLGRALWRIIEKFIMNTPVLRRVYPYVKQITDFVLTQEEQKRLFSRVVAVEYPRKGIWAMGLVTGAGLKKIVDGVQKEFFTVLIPTAPTPFTGFIAMLPKEDTIDLDMTIEEALRFIVSAGVISPTGNKVAVALPKENSETKQYC